VSGWRFEAPAIEIDPTDPAFERFIICQLSNCPNLPGSILEKVFIALSFRPKTRCAWCSFSILTTVPWRGLDPAWGVKPPLDVFMVQAHSGQLETIIRHHSDLFNEV
jgi:hypothetical protein